MTVITEPGVYDIPADIYHADPVPGGSLSSTGARRLLPPSCPARFRYEQDHPRTPTQAMNLGSAAHRVVLNAGADLVVVDADNWKTNAARAERDEALTAGLIPVLPGQHDQIQAMATAIRQHPIASALFNPLRRGRPEQALFWQDRPTGIWRRALVDWLPEPTDRRMIVTDYKTTKAADPDSIQRSVHTLGYHQQAAWYLDGVRAVGGDPDPAFVLVFQETEPPYLITVVELDAMALRIGRDLNRQAIDIYRNCRETGQWPGYSDDIKSICLPAYVENRYLQETS